MGEDDRPDVFEPAFARAARRVRGRLLGRRMLSGAALGMVAGGLAAAGLFWFRQGELRPYTLGLGALGAALGAVVAVLRRWSDEEVALFLDARLALGEEVTTALGLAREKSEIAAHLRARAARSLAKRLGRREGPHVLERWQWLGPLSMAAIAWLSLTALPAATAARVAPGAEVLAGREVPGLERIEALKLQPGRSPEDERKLRALAAEASRLRAQIAKGLAPRDALAQIARLRDAVSELRTEFSNPTNRPGLEAALSELSKNAELGRAARALGDGDLTAFDREMQALANQAEQRAREGALQALEQAERAAREHSAKALADALEAERKTFARRAAEAEALRELGKALGDRLSPEEREDLEEFGKSGSPEAGKRLAEAMGEALGKLTPEERAKLAEQLKKQLGKAGQGAASALSPEELGRLAKQLASPEGQKQLEEELRDLARGKKSEDAERDGALGEAERGADEAERDLRGLPLPTPGNASGSAQAEPGDTDKGRGGPSAAEANGASHGPGKGEGTGSHNGSTKPVPGEELRAKANARRTGVGPMHPATPGRAPAEVGGTANERGTGSLGQVAKSEIGAVEESEVPEEYREHVGRYFEP